MKIETEVEARLFGPKQIAEMTTLAMDGQRNWRHRGHLDPPEGTRGKMSTRAVAALTVRSHASFLGFPPSESRALGEQAAASVIYFALLHEDDEKDVLNVAGPRPAVAEFYHQFGNFNHEARKIAGLSAQPEYKLITWRDREPPELTHDAAEDASKPRPIVFRQINLTRLGVHLARAANGPLFDIKVRTL